MVRSRLRLVIAIVLVASAFGNIWRFHENLAALPPRGSDGRVVWENRLRGIREALIAAHYVGGDIGFMPAGILKGRPRTPQEDVNWVLARYAMIPLNLRQDTLDAPFVIEDFSGSQGAAEIPPGFAALYNAQDGLILLQRKPSP